MVEIKHTTEKLTIQGKINYSSEYTITDIEVPLHEELTNQQQSYDVINHDYSIISEHTTFSIDPVHAEGSVFTAKNEDIATIDQAGQVSVNQSGRAGFTIQTADRAKLKYERYLSYSQRQAQLPTSFVANSLGEHIEQNMQNLVAGLVSDHSTQRYNTVPGGSTWDAPTIIMNNDCFAGGFDWSGLSVTRTNGGNNQTFPIALVSPRHGITAWHVVGSLGIGSQYLFRRADGSHQIATITAQSRIHNLDIALICLDQDITGCSIFKTMPQNGLIDYCKSLYEPYQNGPAKNSKLPILRKAMHFTDETWGSTFQINYLISASETSLINTPQAGIDGYSVYDEFRSWGIKAVGGDSGSPSFLLIDNEPVLICTQYMRASSSNITSYINEINAEMNLQAGTTDTYALQHPDLSKFTSY